MDAATDVLTAARDAYTRRDWPAAWTHFAHARDRVGLSPDDLFLVADVAWWLGRVDDSLAAGEEAYRGLVDRQPRSAAMAAVGMAVNFFLRGEWVHGSGWLSRAQRLLADLPECPEHGYLRYMTDVEPCLDDEDLEPVIENAQRVQEIGSRHQDVNLVAQGMVCEARARIRQTDVKRGVPLLDEVMLLLLGGSLSPEWAGNVYCHLMAACQELGDVHRAAAWTEATTRWLRTLSVAVVFTGVCRVHRAQVLQSAGKWDDAEREAMQVCQDLGDIHIATVAEAHYLLGDLHRVRGHLDAAERAYADARQRGHVAQPGVSLLRLAQGRQADALMSIRAAIASEPRRLPRVRLCEAATVIALGAGDVAAAAAACDELSHLADLFASSGFAASARHARGMVALAQGLPGDALAQLQQACRQWQHLGARYEAAKVRVSMAAAFAALGDHSAAAAERMTAAEIFASLGAAAGAGTAFETGGAPSLPAGLTRREAEVLAEVARGKSNRDVAAQLVISEKTVARHLSNIFTKLQVSSRTEAAAYAYAHGIR